MMKTRPITIPCPTEEQEKEILCSPGTHGVVHQILSLLESKDPVDSLNNLALVTGIMGARVARDLFNATRQKARR
jgi:hypothetical protein